MSLTSNCSGKRLALLASKLPRRFQSASAAPAPTKAKTIQQHQPQLSSFSMGPVAVGCMDSRRVPVSCISLRIPCGTRYQKRESSDGSELGSSQWLKWQAFKSTNKQSSIKITRESDLLGMSLSSSLNRESLILQVDCQRDDSAHAIGVLSDALRGLAIRDNEIIPPKDGIYTREFVRKAFDWKESAVQAAHETENVSDEQLVLDNLHSVSFAPSSKSAGMQVGLGSGSSLYPPASVVSGVDPQVALNFFSRSVHSALCHEGIQIFAAGVDPTDLTAAVEFHLNPVVDEILSVTNGASAEVDSWKFSGKREHFEHLRTSCSGKHIYAIGMKGSKLSIGDFASASSRKNYFGTLLLRQILGSNVGASSDAAASYSIGGFSGSGCLLASNIPADVAEASAFSFSYSDDGILGVLVKADTVDSLKQAVSSVVSSVKSARSLGKGKSGSSVLESAKSKLKLELLGLYELDQGSLQSVNKKSDSIGLLADLMRSNNSNVPSPQDLCSAIDEVDGKAIGQIVDNIINNGATVSAICAQGCEADLPRASQVFA